MDEEMLRKNLPFKFKSREEMEAFAGNLVKSRLLKKMKRFWPPEKLNALEEHDFRGLYKPSFTSDLPWILRKDEGYPAFGIEANSAWQELRAASHPNLSDEEKERLGWRELKNAGLSREHLQNIEGKLIDGLASDPGHRKTDSEADFWEGIAQALNNIQLNITKGTTRNISIADLGRVAIHKPGKAWSLTKGKTADWLMNRRANRVIKKLGLPEYLKDDKYGNLTGLPRFPPEKKTEVYQNWWSLFKGMLIEHYHKRPRITPNDLWQ